MPDLFIGIDASKDHLDLADDNAASVTRFDNTPDGHHAIIKHLRGQTAHRLILEATNDPSSRPSASSPAVSPSG